MLTYDELLSEIRRRSPAEQLALLEELARSLRSGLAVEGTTQPENDNNLYSATNNPPKKPEALGWPPGYFESVYGSLRDTSFERPPQGDYEVREDLD